MTIDLVALSIAAQDPADLGRFWSGLLGWQTADDSGEVVELLANDDTGFRLRFLPTEEPKTRENWTHFDLTSTSLDDQQRIVAGAVDLGGRHIDVGQTAEDPHVVLADPEGNEFCVIEPGNNFLAECGFIGALASDGSQEVGYFWSRALKWPRVWDQDEETAIRSPHGGPKITWGGPPVGEKIGRNRIHFDLAPPSGGDQAAEVKRLVSLGARRGGGSECASGAVAMIDPDGNEFCVLTPR